MLCTQHEEEAFPCISITLLQFPPKMYAGLAAFIETPNFPLFSFPTYAYKLFNLFIEKSEYIFSRLISHQKNKVHTKECSPAVTVMEVLTHSCVNGL